MRNPYTTTAGLYREAHDLAVVLWEGSDRAQALTSITKGISLCAAQTGGDRSSSAWKLLREAINWTSDSTLACTAASELLRVSPELRLPEWLIDKFLQSRETFEALLMMLLDAGCSVSAADLTIRFCQENKSLAPLEQSEPISGFLLCSLQQQLASFDKDALADVQQALDAL